MRRSLLELISFFATGLVQVLRCSHFSPLHPSVTIVVKNLLYSNSPFLQTRASRVLAHTFSCPTRPSTLISADYFYLIVKMKHFLTVTNVVRVKNKKIDHKIFATSLKGKKIDTCLHEKLLRATCCQKPIRVCIRIAFEFIKRLYEWGKKNKKKTVGQ